MTANQVAIEIAWRNQFLLRRHRRRQYQFLRRAALVGVAAVYGVMILIRHF